MWASGTGAVPEGEQARNDHGDDETHHLSRGRALKVMLASGGALLAAFIMAAILVEDVPVRWGSIYLTSITSLRDCGSVWRTSPSTTAMTIGRFTGDRIVDTIGEVRWIRLAMAAVAVAMTAALIIAHRWPSSWLPRYRLRRRHALPRGDARCSCPARRFTRMGVALVTWFSRIGFVVSPLAVGFIAQAAGIPWGMGVVVVAALALIPLTAVLRSTQRA